MPQGCISLELEERDETKVETTGATEGPAQSQRANAPIGVVQSSNPVETSSTLKHPRDVGTENHSFPRSTFGRLLPHLSAT